LCCEHPDVRMPGFSFVAAHGSSLVQ
jgi:hypothetical protein